MLNYDFQGLLSAFEFECFSRDLINVHEGLDLASFAEGRDGGIDLRYTHGKDKSVIVQAKRYKDYSKLKSALKKEVDKVKRLKPNRYILTTTVDMTAANKQEIIGWFSPCIHNERDILAKQDLNKILAQYPEVEQQYYKLWLSSSSVLTSILHKNVVNWTSFEKQNIQETIRTYVMNDSFDEALNKLLKNHYVVISGEPGIGKTTLARVLVAHLLSEKFNVRKTSTHYKEFYFTNGDINDLANVMQEGKRQVFFYDDFLGQIALKEGEKNFENRILSFIRACQAANDKLFILATREYILQQGLAKYPNFNVGKGIELSKCIVDMGKYTRFVRAQILYNHFVSHEIPQSYIDAILKDKNYLKIIDHPHFSPRIIETFLNNGTHETCLPEEYYDKIKGFFDHPDSVWLDAFHKLTDVEQEALLVLNTMGAPVMMEDWKEAYYRFFHEVHKEANYIKNQTWNDIVKVLQNNFIKTGNGARGIFVGFHNPGVIDVLTRIINQDDSIKRLLLEHACFIEQIFGVFTSGRRYYYHKTIPASFCESFVTAFDKCWDNYKSCRTLLYRDPSKIEYYGKEPRTKVEVLNMLLYSYADLEDVMPGYVEKKITQELMTDAKYGYLASQLRLLEKIDLSKTSLNMDELFSNYCERLDFGDDCLSLASSIKNVFPNHIGFLESDEFCLLAADCLRREFKFTKESDLEGLDSMAKDLCEYIPMLEYNSVVDEIRSAKENYDKLIEAQAEEYEDDFSNRNNNSSEEDTWKIDNLFATLRG